MKLLMLALIMISTMNGMDRLLVRAERARTIYLYELSCESFFSAYGNNINECINGRTMLDLVYARGPVDFELVEFLRERGALTNAELPLQTNQGLLRAVKLVKHIVQSKAS